MILVGKQIKEWFSKDWPEKLVVTPLLSSDGLEDHDASVDVRLGQQFLVTSAAGVTAVDPLDPEFKRRGGLPQQIAHVPVGSSFMLHPGRFALAATLEYLRLPHGLAAYVIGRSSWARVGLVIAMATAVHPGFAGVLTLELQNLGDVPIALCPGSRVAQLIFHTTSGDAGDLMPPPGAYSCQTGPGPTALWEDPEWKILGAIRDLKKGAT